MFGNFISEVKENNCIHIHRDPRSRGKMHIRLNFVVQKSEIGGNPIIIYSSNRRQIAKREKFEYDIQEKCSWINFASEWFHGTTKVFGSRKRIVLSLGTYVDVDLAQKVLQSLEV